MDEIPMTDEQLALAVCPNDPARGAMALAKMTIPERETLRALESLFFRIKLYEDGLGPKPMDAIVCGPNEIREGRGPKAQSRK